MNYVMLFCYIIKFCYEGHQLVYRLKSLQKTHYITNVLENDLCALISRI